MFCTLSAKLSNIITKLKKNLVVQVREKIPCFIIRKYIKEQARLYRINSHKLLKNLIIEVSVGFFILRYQSITSKEMELHFPWAFTCVAIKKWWGLPSSIMESKQVEPLTGFLWWEQFRTWNLWAINFAPYSAFPNDSSSFITHLKTRRDNNF